MFNLKFRDQLLGAVGNELENLVASLKTYVLGEHDENGSHTDIEADSLTLQDAAVGELINLPYDATRFFSGNSAVWTVQEADVVFLRASRIGQLVFVQFNLQATDIATDTTDTLYIKLPELHAISNLTPAAGPAYQGAGTLSYTDAAESGIGPVFAQAQGFADVKPSTLIELNKIDPTTGTFGLFAIGAVSIVGSVWFTCEPNNVPTAFYGS